MYRLRILFSPHFSSFHKLGACYISTSHALDGTGTGACLTKPDYGPLDIGRCTIMNGIRLVAAKPQGAQMASCTILYQGGSRFEVDDQRGITHFLRTCSPASGCAYTSFSKTRVLQQVGAYITVNTDRQSVAYTLRCPVSAFHDVKYYLLDIAARSKFKQHEIDARKPQVKLDLETVHPEALVIDLAQKACWGGGLNNSIFCEEGRIDSMSASDMDIYTALHMRSDECTVGSYGLAFEDMMTFAEMIETNRSQQMDAAMTADIQMPCEEIVLLNKKIDFNLEMPQRPRYYPPSFARGGFEYHDLGPGSDTWIAVVVPSCGNLDLPLLMKHSIVAAACGTGNNTRGQHRQDRDGQWPLGLFATDVHTQYKAFNLAYADTGVFGIVVRSPSYGAGGAAHTAVNFLKNLGELTCDQLFIGKKRLKLDISLNDDDCVNISEGLALQAACNFRLDNAYSSLGMLNMITEQECSSVAKCLASKYCKMAVAVVGDVQAVPHDRELFGF